MATGVKKSGVEWGVIVGAQCVDALGAQIYVDKLNLEKEVESLKVKKLSQQKSTKFSQSKSQFFFGRVEEIWGCRIWNSLPLIAEGRMRLASLLCFQWIFWSGSRLALSCYKLSFHPYKWLNINKFAWGYFTKTCRGLITPFISIVGASSPKNMKVFPISRSPLIKEMFEISLKTYEKLDFE